MAHPTSEAMKAHFENAARTYEESFPIMATYAQERLRLLPPIDSSSVFHDNACGPGIVSEAILTSGATPQSLHATDVSAPMLSVLETKSIASKIQAEVMDMKSLTFADETFTHSATNFAIMSLSVDDGKMAAAEIYRTLKPGGAAQVSTWAVLGYMDVLQDVMEQVKPGSKHPEDLPIPKVWRQADTLVDVLVAGGFSKNNITITQVERDMGGDMWTKPGIGAMKDVVLRMSTEGWSEAEKKELEEKLEKRIQEEKERPRMYKMVANMAVAMK